MIVWIPCNSDNETTLSQTLFISMVVFMCLILNKMNLFLRDIFVILALCNISVNAIPCDIELEKRPDGGFTVKVDRICKCMGYDTPVKSDTLNIEKDLGVGSWGVSFNNGSIALGQPDKICLSVGFSKNNTVAALLKTTLSPESSTDVKTTKRTERATAESDTDGATTIPTKITTVTTETVTGAIATKPTDITTVPTVTISDITSDKLKSTTAESDMYPTTTKSTGPINSTSESVTVANATRPTKITTVTTETVTGAIATKPTDITTVPTVTISDITSDKLKSDRKKQENKSNIKKTSISSVVLILISSLIAGCLIAWVAKIIHDLYKSKEYELPPDQQELESRPNGNTEETRVEL